MKRFGVFALLMLFAAPAVADAIYYPPLVTGKRERKNTRHLLYILNLSGDKKAVFDEYGYTPHRIRVNAYGRVEEQWTYHEVGRIFVFDPCDNLVETHTTPVEHRRDWVYQDDRSACRDRDHGN